MNKTDTTINVLMDIIKAKKAELLKLAKPVYLTNCSFPINGSNVNLHTISTVDMVINITSKLISDNYTHVAACKELNVEKPYKVSNYTYDEWLSDFKTVAGRINIKQTEKELAEYEVLLDQEMNPEIKRQKKIEDIAKSLKEKTW